MSQVGGHDRREGSLLRQAAEGIGLVTMLAVATMLAAWLLALVIALVW
ncbi:MAG: hypothetical protein R3320_03125 [Nitriliruptorales bacterium]|nr:hypothetical protein [Nitriliruptorales bacterium]